MLTVPPDTSTAPASFNCRNKDGKRNDLSQTMTAFLQAYVRRFIPEMNVIVDCENRGGLCPARRKMSKPVLPQDSSCYMRNCRFWNYKNSAADNASPAFIKGFYFFRFPARARMRRTFLGEIDNRLATR